jgi:O-antigen/teichoic acid export membrane protein
VTTARRALAYTLAAQYAVLVIQFVATVIIARLLTPSEIGIFSVGAALVGLGHILRDFGSGQYIVQEQDLTEQRIRAAFTVTLLLGWSIAAVVYAISPFAGGYYNEPGLESVLALLALNFFLLPLGSVTLAYCRRQMNFRPAAIASTASSLVQAAVSVALAYLGFSYMSLAWGSLAGTVTTILIVYIMRPPGLPYLPGFRELRRVLGFGGKASFVSVLGEIGAIVPQLVLGKSLGFHAVGLYSRTQGTITLFQRLVMQGVSPVIGPVFARHKREGADLRAAFVYATTCVSGVAWFFYANLLILAEPFTLALFGQNWAEIIPLVQMWCVAASVFHLTSLVEQAFTNIGEIDRLVRFTAILQPIRIVALAAGAMISLEAVLIVIVCIPFLRLALLWPQLRAVLEIKLTDYRPLVIRSGLPALASAGAALAGQAALGAGGVSSVVLIVAVCGILSTIVWISMIHLIRHPLAGEFWALVRRQPPVGPQGAPPQ